MTETTESIQSDTFPDQYELTKFLNDREELNYSTFESWVDKEAISINYVNGEFVLIYKRISNIKFIDPD
ncbi:MAG: hypothetical protein JWO03_3861 [Bacteroidetes bacterium]|nr:hypothetical protein [Bacteroidota bacterium]